MVNVGSMFTFITKCTLKILFIAVGGRFTFTICSHFHRTGIVVPHNSHATKSNSIPKNHSTHLFGQNLTIPYPNSYSQELQQNNPIPHYLSSTLSNYPTPSKP